MSEGANRVKRDGELTQDPRRMKRRRLMARLSFREAAAKAGISCGHISDLEKGHKSAGVDALRKLADAYGCEVADFLPPERAVA
jgi:transcriptional regulator with XRE-family HTH domain